jgi:putative DNA primase/helicase
MLAGVVHTPLILPDGRLITAEGYDKGTGLLFDFRGAAFPVVMRKPSKSDAEQALSRMRKRSKTFPFVDAASEAADMSMLFTTVFRRVLSAAPGHLATATKPGTGKSYRTDTASIYATGHRAGVIPYDSEDQAEMQKTLVSLMLEGVAVITIDNIDGVLKNTLLTQMLTQPFVKPRQLNFNKAPHYPTNLAVNANGNGVQLSFDLMRRFIISRLDAGVPYPEKRPFDFNPLDLAKAHRPQVIADMITILLYYENAGRPDQPALGDNYRDWASWIIGALMHLGMEDPRQTADDMRENASDTENFNSLMLQWKVAAGYGVPVTAGKLVEMALKSSDNPGGRHFDHLHFYELLQLLAADAGKISSRRLGEYLKKRVDYVTEIEEERPGNPVTWRYRLVKEKKKDSYTGVALWRVDKFDLQGNPAPDMPPSVDQVLPPRETDDYPAF